jgi:hypothetical protein
VESESGETSMASVMNSLKKIVKAINPKYVSGVRVSLLTLEPLIWY